MRNSYLQLFNIVRNTLHSRNGYNPLVLCRPCVRVDHGQTLFSCRQNRFFNKWTFDVKPFGNLSVKTGPAADVQIHSIDPQKYPLQNKVFVTVDKAGVKCAQEGESEIEITNEQVQDQAEGDIEESTNNELVQCSVHVPIKFDVQVEVFGDSSVTIGKLENESIVVSVEDGNCTLANIQTGQINVDTQGGNIITQAVLQGNGALCARGEGSIDAHKIQGLNFNFQSEAGDINVKALYADESKFETHLGNVHIGNCHREALVHIKQQGDLTIDSLDGTTMAKVMKGNITAYLCQHESVYLETDDGDINLKVQEDICSKVDLEAGQVSISVDLDSTKCETKSADLQQVTGTLGSTDSPMRSLKAKTQNGNITMECQDWLSSLGLTQARE